MAYVKTNWVDNTTPINETNLNKIESGIKNNDINIGEENYDNTKTYEVGDIVRYNEKIYKCITAITTAENFDISKWEQTNIVEIVQSEKSKIYELIEALSTPIVGEGENITLNDTAEKRFENFDIEGNSVQKMREGYQLLNLQSGMQNGITYYVDDEGYFYISGTCTSDRITLNLNEMVLNGTYTFTNKSIRGEGINCALKDNTSEYKTIFWANNNNSTKEVNAILKDLVCYLTNGATYNSKVKLMLVSGSQEKDIEQYGASPSPDYPSEVECCGDNINIFDGEVEKGNINASTGQNTATTNAWRSKNYLNVKDTSVSISVKDLTFSGTVGSLYFYKSDNTYISNILINSLPFTATLPNETAKVRFFILNSVADINAKIKLEKGSTVTPYSPPNQGCINEVICNKNLFDKESVLTGTAIQRNTGNILTTSAYSTYSTSDYCKVKSSTTYFLGIAYSSTNFGVVYYDKDKNHISGEKLNNYFTTPSNCEYVRFTWITADYNISTIQLEEGTTATEYVEHKSQTYTIPTQQSFRAIGDIRDTFIKKNNKWYEHHPIVRIESYNGETITSEYISNTGELSTGATVDYISDTPVDIECTEEQSTILFDIEQNAKTYDKVTHIYSNDEVSPNCYVEAVKDLTTLIQ